MPGLGDTVLPRGSITPLVARTRLPCGHVPQHYVARPVTQQAFHSSQNRTFSSTACSCSQRAAEPDTIQELLRQARAKRQGEGPGEVYLVGTGPGDPGLLTLRAVQLMQTADVVLYDRLISPEILQLVHGGAVMVYVGKNKGFHTRTQTEIHELLCQFAQQGSRTLRLKGGNPFIFGRGGEEVQYLQQRGVRVHTVPGVTAASGISAELGIPLTHRGLATRVTFMTGHAREGGEADLDSCISSSVDPYATLVVYMGLATLPTLSARLIDAGMAADTPAAAVERGTTADQRSVYAPISQLTAEVARHNLQSPTLLIIGPVVSLSAGWQHVQASGITLVEGQPICWDGIDVIAEAQRQTVQPVMQ